MEPNQAFCGMLKRFVDLTYEDGECREMVQEITQRLDQRLQWTWPV